MNPCVLISFSAGEKIHVEVVDAHLVVCCHCLGEPQG